MAPARALGSRKAPSGSSTPALPVSRTVNPVTPRTLNPVTPRSTNPGTPRCPDRGTGRRTMPAIRTQPVPDPWAEVREATAEADALETMLVELDAAVAEEELRAEEAEAALREEEQELTERTSSMLAEFANLNSKNLELEEELETAKKDLSERLAENLQLSTKNRELDKEAATLKEQIAEAKAQLEKCSGSREILEGERVQQLEACEKIRVMAQSQGERLTCDLQRFAAIRTRLLEVSGRGAPGESQKLLAEADSIIREVSAAKLECDKIAVEGLVPAICKPPSEQQCTEASEAKLECDKIAMEGVVPAICKTLAEQQSTEAADDINAPTTSIAN